MTHPDYAVSHSLVIFCKLVSLKGRAQSGGGRTNTWEGEPARRSGSEGRLISYFSAAVVSGYCNQFLYLI